MKEHDMSRPCSMDGRGEKCLAILDGHPEGKRPLGDSGVNWRIILRWILEK
jgi:hypothetical protein